MQRGLRIERREPGGGLGAQEGERFGEPRRGRRGALPGERGLLAGRHDEQRFVGFLRSRGGAAAGRHVRDQALRERLQPQQRVRIAAQRRADRRRQERPQRRVQIARQQDVEQVPLVEPRLVAAPEAVVHRAGERVAVQPADQGGEVGHGFGRDAGAHLLRAELPQDRGQRLEARDREGFGPVRGDHGVEHHRFDVLRVAFGVLERDLGPVGGAVQDQLRVPGRPAERLDVLDRFLRRERARARVRSVPRTAGRCGRASRGRASSAGQLRGSELPVPRWSKTSRSRLRSAGAIVLALNSAKGSAGWPGPPAIASSALGAGRAARELAPDAQRDRPWHRPGAVERHREVAAGHVRLSCAGGEAKGRGGVRGGGPAGERERGQQGRRDPELNSPQHRQRQ